MSLKNVDVKKDASDLIDDVPASVSAVAAEQPVAVRTETLPSASTQVAEGYLQSLVQQLKEEGIEGLELSFASFIHIKLDKVFIASDGTELDGKDGFAVRTMQQRSKYAFKSNHTDQAEVEVVYDYDPNADKDPQSSVYEAIQKWRQAGFDYVGTPQQYVEIWAIMADDGMEGALNGALVSLSIPKTSIPRLTGVRIAQKGRGLGIGDYLLRCRRGAKFEAGGFTVTPWDFRAEPIV